MPTHPLPIFLINLNASNERLSRMEEQFARNGIPPEGWTRVAALYGNREVPPGCLRSHSCALDAHAQGEPRLHPRSAAVAFSHMRAWRAVEALPQSGWGAGIVLEDDAILQRGFAVYGLEAHRDHRGRNATRRLHARAPSAGRGWRRSREDATDR